MESFVTWAILYGAYCEHYAGLLLTKLHLELRIMYRDPFVLFVSGLAANMSVRHDCGIAVSQLWDACLRPEFGGQTS
eukprot:4695884-Heterocapsa_arctica.AAC.1